MKLSQYAKEKSVTYQTAWNHFKRGLIDGAYQLPTGTVIVPEKAVDDKRTKTIIYARVSSSQNRKNLQTQSQRLSEFCVANGWVVDDIVMECASGVNDKQPKFLRILKDPTIKRIVVEHKDRLTRFGFNYIDTLFDGEIVVVNKADDTEEDIVQDLTSIITSFCARIYGQRRSKRKTEQLIESLKHNE